MRLTGLLLLTLLLCAAPLRAQEEGCGAAIKSGDRKDYEQAVKAFDAKRYTQCITLMRGVSKRNPTAADPYYYLGAAAIKSNERPAVIKGYFSKLMRYCPDYPNALAYYYMGVVEYSYKRYDEAVQQLNRYFDMANGMPRPEYDAVYEEASAYLYWAEFLSEAEQNAVPFYPQPLYGASSKANELLPYISPDGKELYFLRQMAVAPQSTFYHRQTEEQVLRLCRSTWKDTAYSYGEVLPYPFNQGGEQGGVTMSADGKTMYLAILGNDRGYADCDIWRCRRRGGIWQELENAGRAINGERSWDAQPSLTPDGQYLYFASNRSGGMGGTDIWRCRRLASGEWSRAENLGPAINTAGNEKCPFIHADGHTLYFASDGWQGFGGYDMYFIDVNNTYLQRPTNLGLPINTEVDDICLGVSTDGKRAYFAGQSVDWVGVGGSDLYSFELYPAAQPEEMAIVTTRPLRSSDGKACSGTVRVLRQKVDADEYPFAADDSTLALALAVRSNNTVIVSADSCLPLVVTGNAAQLRRDMQAASFVLHRATLLGRYPLPLPKASGRSLLPLSSDATAVLDAYVDYLLAHPRMHIRIEAPRMDEEQAIHDYLRSRQLRAERLDFKPNSALSAPLIVITEM